MFALQCTLCWLHCMTIKCRCSWRPHNCKLYPAYTVALATPTIVAWYWSKYVLHSGWLCTIFRPAIRIQGDVVHWLRMYAMSNCACIQHVFKRFFDNYRCGICLQRMIMRCAPSLVGPQILSTVHTTGKWDYTESCAQTDGHLFVNVTDILHTTHNCNSDTIRFQLLMITYLWFHLHSSCCGASLASFLRFEKYTSFFTLQ